jgi:hypothetical protein
MKKQDNTLYIDESLEFSDCEELVESLEELNNVVVASGDIHPSALQLLLSVSKEKNITIEDDFYRRFFENLHLRK